MMTFFDTLFRLKFWQKVIILICVDFSVITASMFLALGARLEHHQFIFLANTYFVSALSSALIISFLQYHGFYRIRTRYMSTEAAAFIVYACAVSAAVLFTLATVGVLQLPRSVPFIHAAFSCVAIAGVRFFVRALGQHVHSSKKQRLAVYGAGISGRQLIEAMKWNPKYHVKLLIDDDPELQGQNFGGLKVMTFESAVNSLAAQNINTVILAIQDQNADKIQAIVNALTALEINVKAIPDLTSLISNQIDVTNFQEIKIEDLLGRPSTETKSGLVNATITGKNVLVTGAGGSIGSELCRQIIELQPSRLILFDVSEFAIYKLLQDIKSSIAEGYITPFIGSIQNTDLLNKVLSDFSIDTVYHAAAYKHVPLMEHNVVECFRNNVIGTAELAKSAITNQVSNFILISTDKAVNPTNYMGASKRFAELICQSLDTSTEVTKFTIVRFGNVLGSSGSVVPLFRSQIEAGGPVTVTHEDVTRYFMTIPEAAQLVLQAATLDRSGRVYVLDMGKQIKIIDLAKKMIILSGKKPVMNKPNAINNNEIYVKITGLRPGEKMYEELSYNDHLIGTQHPKIMETGDDRRMPERISELLTSIEDSVERNDLQALYEAVKEICDGVPDPTGARDFTF